eukprot:8646010-Lingulodinium_polyedra.AAC.1
MNFSRIQACVDGAHGQEKESYGGVEMLKNTTSTQAPPTVQPQVYKAIPVYKYTAPNVQAMTSLTFTRPVVAAAAPSPPQSPAPGAFVS